jgi:hypothetical protein
MGTALIQSSDKGSDRPYTGSSGRTRTERVRVFRPGRGAVESEVFRVVNVAEQPELREPALNGALHRLDDGEIVEVPFVFHDPCARQFVLVVPEHARGRELSERAKLLERFAMEGEATLPPYVRNHEVVYGSEGLARHLEDAQRMEVDVHELEPVDRHEPASVYYPGLAGRLPHARFWQRPDEEMAMLFEDDMLWVFVQLATEESAAFAESSSDFRVQLKTVDQVPVCILALVDLRAGTTRRAFLNPAPSADRSILQRLRREFRASVVVLDDRRNLERTFLVEAPRAANAAMILQRTERAPLGSDAAWRLAVDACRLAPLPIGRVQHPFVLRDDAKTALEALERLSALEAWMTPERIDHALLVESIPRHVFEIARQQIVRDAVRFGLAMSDTLLAQAVRSGLAPDSGSLVESLGRRFAEIVPSTSEHGLGEAVVEANWAALGRLSRLHGTSTERSLSCTMEHSG